MSDKYETDKNNKFISLSDICPTNVRHMTVKISFRLSNEIYNNVKNLSDKTSDSMSDICRTAIEQYIEEQRKGKNNKIQKTDDKILINELINQQKSEISYLKKGNSSLRKQLDEDIHNIQSQFDELMTNIKITNNTLKINTSNKKKSGKERLNSRM